MKVKIELQKGETKEVAEELLYKALKSKKKANEKHSEKFDDPGISLLEKEMMKIHDQNIKELLDEITKVIK